MYRTWWPGIQGRLTSGIDDYGGSLRVFICSEAFRNGDGRGDARGAMLADASLFTTAR